MRIAYSIDHNVVYQISKFGDRSVLHGGYLLRRLFESFAQLKGGRVSGEFLRKTVAAGHARVNVDANRTEVPAIRGVVGRQHVPSTWTHSPVEPAFRTAVVIAGVWM